MRCRTTARIEEYKVVDSCSICVYLFDIHLTGGTNDIDQVQHETLTYTLQLAKVDDVMDCMPHLMSDTGDNMLVFRHVCSLLFSFSSMGILLSSALSGPPMPKTNYPPTKLCDFVLQTM